LCSKKVGERQTEERNATSKEEYERKNIFECKKEKMRAVVVLVMVLLQFGVRKAEEKKEKQRKLCACRCNGSSSYTLAFSYSLLFSPLSVFKSFPLLHLFSPSLPPSLPPSSPPFLITLPPPPSLLLLLLLLLLLVMKRAKLGQQPQKLSARVEPFSHTHMHHADFLKQGGGEGGREGG